MSTKKPSKKRRIEVVSNNIHKLSRILMYTNFSSEEVYSREAISKQMKKYSYMLDKQHGILDELLKELK